jgi:Tfp pilus assembly protein PilV
LSSSSIKATGKAVDGGWVTPARAQSSRASEQGFALIEVLVSALCIAIVGGAVLTTLQATARSASDSRNHTMAQALAMEDQARLRSMRISSLNGLNQTYEVTLDGTVFSISSTGVFVNNTSQTASCTSGQTSADYIRIASSVTWNALGKNRPPVSMQSIVSPSNGSLDPGHGTLTFSAINAAGLPLAGLGISGTGPGNFSGTTDATGCANFADLPAGNYTVAASAPTLVDKEGKAPTTLSPSPGVIASGTQTVTLQYDKPGALEVDFKYRVGSTSEFKASSASAIQVFNSGMKEPFTFTAPGGVPAATVATTAKLFPFTSPYAVYAGSCTSTNPNPTSDPEAPGALAVAGVTVPPGATLAPLPKGTIQLPALNLVVKEGSTFLSGAKVKITGTCSYSREFTTTTGGVLADQGLPWGTYTICAQKGSGSSTRRKTVSNQAVQTLTSATSVTIDLGSGTSSGSCP